MLFISGNLKCLENLRAEQQQFLDKICNSTKYLAPRWQRKRRQKEKKRKEKKKKKKNKNNYSKIEKQIKRK
jgi:hypothetical protein